MVITPIPGNKSGKQETSNDCTLMCIDTLKGMLYLHCELIDAQTLAIRRCLDLRYAWNVVEVAQNVLLLSSPCGLFVITRRSYKFCSLATVLLLSSCYDLSKSSRGFTSLLTSSLLLCILPEQISFQSNSNGKRIKTLLTGRM